MKKYFKLSILTLSLLMFHSCDREEKLNQNSETALRFKKSLDLNRSKIENTNLKTENYSRISGSETIYLHFSKVVTAPNMSQFSRINTISDLSTLISSTDAIVNYNGDINKSKYRITIPTAPIIVTLSPLIVAAKEYLYTKGFTDNSIRNMIVSESGTELDLIPFVMSLYHLETGGSFPAFSLSNKNRVISNDFIRCAMVALGADVLWSLGTSSASSWSIVAMKKAFATVAKRFLGPIGVAIAVVSFGTCIGEAYFRRT